MWDQYDIGFGNNRACLPASVPISIPIGIPISVRDNVQIGIFFSFPPKVPVKVNDKVPTNVRVVKTVKQAHRYPQSETYVSETPSFRGPWRPFAWRRVCYIQRSEMGCIAYKAYERAQNVADVMSLVADIFERVEEGKKLKNKRERPEFNDTDAARGVHPQDVLRQAAMNTGGLVPTAVTGESLNNILENVRQVETQNVELKDRPTAPESHQEEDFQTIDSIDEEVGDFQERLKELERQDGRTPGNTAIWPGFYAKCWNRIHDAPWQCVEGVCYLICSLCHTAMPKRGDSGKAPVCCSCQNTAAKRRKPAEAGLKKFADVIKARSNGALWPAGETASVRKRRAEELEGEPDGPGQNTANSTGLWHSSNPGTEQEEQSTRRKRRRVSDADVDEADSDSAYRGRRPTRTQGRFKKRCQAKENNEPSSKPTRRSPRIAAQRSSP
ncbi:hypothetical protein DL768_010449 [Monosporascus sp. mg162]|nr:hypothetical protein DL768_010449 [Monosporascus sp. mg162]